MLKNVLVHYVNGVSLHVPDECAQPRQLHRQLQYVRQELSQTVFYNLLSACSAEMSLSKFRFLREQPVKQLAPMRVNYRARLYF